ncbi:hypothetical protein [Paenibacillus sp. Marseille-Q7038]
MKRRNHWILFVVLLLSLTILSPSLDLVQDQKKEERDDVTDIFSVPAPETTHKNKPLSVLVSMEEEEYKIFQRFAMNIAKEIDMEINITNIELADFYSTFKETFIMGESPDTLLIDNRYIKWYAKKGYARPMTGGDGNIAAGDSFDSVLRAGEWNGYLWSIPMDIDPYVYTEYRNEETSKEPLQSTSTRDEWISRLTEWGERLNKPFYFNGEDPMAYASWLTFLGVYSEVSHVFRLNEGQEEDRIQKIRAIQTLFSYIKTERYNLSSVRADFQAGIITLSELIPVHREELSSYINNDVKSQSLAVKGRSFILSPKSTQKEATVEFLTKLTSPKSAKTWFTLSGKLPVYSTLYADPDLSDITNAIPLQALEESMDESLLQDEDHVLSDPEKSWAAAKTIQQFVHGQLSFEEYKLHLNRLMSDSR